LLDAAAEIGSLITQSLCQIPYAQKSTTKTGAIRSFFSFARDRILLSGSGLIGG
jgi:hypothetical protein